MKKIARIASLALGVCAVLYLCIPLAADAGVGGAAMTQGSNGYPENVRSTSGAVHVVPMAADGGYPVVSVLGGSTAQGTTPDGGTATIRLDGDRRQVVAVGGVSGACLGADLTTASGSGPTLAAGTEYRVCALTDLWISWAGGTAAADAPSEPVFARTCVVRGPFSSQTTPTAILPAGASVLAGKELVACPVTRPQ